MNQKVIDATKVVKVYDVARGEKDLPEPKIDRRLKRNDSPIDTNKIDVDYQNYGYVCPEKMKPGTITLRQFDEFINEFKEKKSIDLVNETSSKYGIISANIYVLTEFYKPFVKLQPKESSNPTINKQRMITDESKIQKVFPNIR